MCCISEMTLCAVRLLQDAAGTRPMLPLILQVAAAGQSPLQALRIEAKATKQLQIEHLPLISGYATTLRQLALLHCTIASGERLRHLLASLPHLQVWKLPVRLPTTQLHGDTAETVGHC